MQKLKYITIALAGLAVGLIMGINMAEPEDRILQVDSVSRLGFTIICNKMSKKCICYKTDNGGIPFLTQCP